MSQDFFFYIYELILKKISVIFGDWFPASDCDVVQNKVGL